MKKRPQPDWMTEAECVGKDRFESHDLAEHVARRMRSSKSKISVFRCRSCGGWHVGSGFGVKANRDKK